MKVSLPLLIRLICLPLVVAWSAIDPLRREIESVPRLRVCAQDPAEFGLRQKYVLSSMTWSEVGWGIFFVYEMRYQHAPCKSISPMIHKTSNPKRKTNAISRINANASDNHAFTPATPSFGPL